jgi:predicted ATPase
LLPAPLTRLIGREAEVALLRARLQDGDARLMTLTGAGGTGKTRLAIAVAAGMRDAFPGGVYFVDLAPLTDPALVVPTVAATLGVREAAGQPPIATLATALAPGRLLLVLDNCERLLGAASDITALLAACPDVTVFATSRKPFRVRGEHEFPLLPLPLPAADRELSAQELAQVPAVALFLERATAVQPDIALTADTAAAVAAICHRLDGLPLAIELAAARVKVLPPAALLARLEPRLPLLTGGGGDRPARQRTMRATIAWSHDLLAPEEQVLFRRLAVFAGGFTLEAAEAVAAPDRHLSVLEGVGALVEQSLLRRTPGRDDSPRFRMLETVREYGLELLTLAGETAEVRARHAHHFLRLAEGPPHAEPLSTTARIHESLRRLPHIAPELDNVRLALAWFDKRGETDALGRLSAALHGLWIGRGLHHEGLGWAARALERSGHAPTVARVRAVDAASRLALFQGDYARAADFVGQSLTLARELGDPLEIGQALTNLGLLSYRRGEYGHAEEVLDEACRLLRGLDTCSPDVVVATGRALLILGDTALVQERFDRAERRLEESVALFHDGRHSFGLSDAQAGLGAVRYCTGNYGAAAALYAESFNRARDLGYPLMVASSLIGLAGVAAEVGRPEEGARLLGAAEGIATAIGAPGYPRDRPVRDRVLAALRSALGEDRLSAELEAGHVLSLERAAAEARNVARAMSGAAH